MNSRTKRILASYVSLLLVLMSALSLSCGIHIISAHSVEVQNNFDKPVVILGRLSINGEWGEIKNWGQVDPGARRAVFSMVEPTSKSEDKKYQVEARDLDGKLIESWEFPFQDRVLLVIDNNGVPKQ